MIDDKITIHIVAIYLNLKVVEINSLGTKVNFRFTIIVFYNRVEYEYRNSINRQKYIFLRNMNNALIYYCNGINYKN